MPGGSWRVPTLFPELDDQLADLGLEQPDMVLVPTGVGSLLQAALTHYRAAAPVRPRLWSLSNPWKPLCVQASIAAGHPVSRYDGSHDHGRPELRNRVEPRLAVHLGGLDAAATVTDDQATWPPVPSRRNGVPVGPWARPRSPQHRHS